ncbi:MAG: hypothetical protein CL557_11535 [Alphaproteobacteria bacterium]|nr:hypothetical protein [Alphaproteobacteria bacterium]
MLCTKSGWLRERLKKSFQIYQRMRLVLQQQKQLQLQLEQHLHRPLGLDLLTIYQMVYKVYGVTS